MERGPRCSVSPPARVKLSDKSALIYDSGEQTQPAVIAARKERACDFAVFRARLIDYPVRLVRGIFEM